MKDPVIEVDGLRVELVSGEAVVEDVTFQVGYGTVLALVGESGSGKTTTALALLGYAKPGALITGGVVKVGGAPVTGRPERELRHVRGRLISYVPQDPASALNPSIRVGDQVAQILRRHTPTAEPTAEVARAFELVQLPTRRDFLRRFPHQLSGGQQQRVAIAGALVCRPAVVVMDEPTTGLDVVTQANLLAEVARLRTELQLAIVYVSHDLAVVASIADRIAVMYAGRIVEQGTSLTVLDTPRHPYTLGLLSSVPDPREPRQLASIPGVAAGVGERTGGCTFAPRCPQRVGACDVKMPELESVDSGGEVRCFEWMRTPSLIHRPRNVSPPRQALDPLLAVEGLTAAHSGRDGTVVAAENISFSIERGECVALVGESGSGKTTIARCIAGLHPPAAGKILLDGRELAAAAGRRSREDRRRIQIVFQNPYDSLNPRHRIGDAIARPMTILGDRPRKTTRLVVAELLERVRLPARLADRFPAELSGGERQRVAIARALAATPHLVVSDEITSALDVSVQAAVLELLAELRDELGLALLLITHDLGVVASVADRVLVLNKGTICEQGAVTRLLARPEDAYTIRLVAAAPSISRAGSNAS